MANTAIFITMLLYAILLLISTTSGSTIVRPSRRYMKSKISEYATPLDVCYGRNIGGRARSMKLVCEEECEYDDNNEPYDCNRNVVAYKYRNEVCDLYGDEAFALDIFHPRDRGSYPYNCYEAEEMEGEDIDQSEYEVPHMIVRLEYGLLLEDDLNVTYDVLNENNETETVWNLEDRCIKKPNQTFYRSFAAITDQCHLAWKGPNNNHPVWFRAHCNDNAFLLQKFTQYGCPNESEVTTGNWPLYQENGCKPKPWMDKYWYTEVVKCTHPKWNIGKATHYYGHYHISLIFILLIMIIYG